MLFACIFCTNKNNATCLSFIPLCYLMWGNWTQPWATTVAVSQAALHRGHLVSRSSRSCRGSQGGSEPAAKGFGHQTLRTKQRGQTRPSPSCEESWCQCVSIWEERVSGWLKWGSHWPGRLQPSAALRVETIVLHYQNALVLVLKAQGTWKMPCCNLDFTFWFVSQL